jgi:hypothetical protein
MSMHSHFKLVLGAVLAVGLGVLPARADDRAGKPPAERKSIDVVICLDVSNSMDGLIASAKAKLWDIVNDLARAKPTPDLRVGLYSYGHSTYDANAGWVRKELDLTTDLDAVSQKLFGLTTNGGEEYVARVCRDAIDQQKWSDAKDALRLIFVCGNEPASQDKQVRLATVAEKAKAKSIVINPIFCGNANENDARDWKEFATMAGGRFMNIDQQGGTVAIATPHDKELIELGTKLNTTYLAYGRVEARQEKALNQSAQDANALKLGAGAAAGRAVSKGGGLYRNSDWDLVDRLKEDPKFDVKKVPVDELCDELKKMTPEEREKHVKDMLAKRESIQKQIDTLNAKRQAYIAEQMKKHATKADKMFDEAVRETIREQAKSRGIDIPK